MQNTCPCCKRALPRTTAKSPADKKLAQDTARAQDAIESLRRFCHGGYLERCAEEYHGWSKANRNDPSVLMLEAAQDEINRLENAIQFPAILWRIYRRADKGESYVKQTPNALDWLKANDSQIAEYTEHAA